MLKNAPLLSCAVLAAAMFAVTPNKASACGTEAYIGEICITSGIYCPYNTAEPMGQTLQISTYTGLFALLSCQYGGDCRTTFALPDLRGRIPVQYGQGPGLTNRPWAMPFGQEGISQTGAMMAPHTHNATFQPTGTSNLGVTVAIPASSGNAATTDTPGTSVDLAQTSPTFDLTGLGGTNSPANIYSNAAPDTTLMPFNATVTGAAGGGSVAIGATGSGSAIPTVPPELAMRYCIVLNGLYPSRP